ncbi:AraC family transcriptional regulator [Aquirhabdus sp.]|uniref:AraC family transcriptional regulator n=1 Tax=Aquirhabdus sp. TaxID=2824160 RepID=UPI00396CDAF4
MSDSNIFFLNADEAMRRIGVDTTEIYRRIGIDPEKLLQPGVRIPHQAQVRFWAVVESVTGDAEIGLHLCPFVSPFAGEIMNHLFISSRTIRDGVRRATKYLRLISDHMDVHLVTNEPDQQASLIATLGDTSTPRHTEIMFFYGMLQAFNLATAGKFKPERLELRAIALDNRQEFESIFGCPVDFGASATRIYFDRAMLDLPLLHADPDLANAQEAVVHRHMRRLAHLDTVDAVRTIMVSELESGLCSPSWIASQLKRSPRGLRAELLDAGTSFNQILDDVRRSVAKQLLAQTEEPIAYIAHLTGFANPNAFFRAFKRWNGSTPMQYRIQKNRIKKNK